MNIIEVRSHHVLLIPEVQQLLKNAVEDDHFFYPHKIEDVVEDLLDYVIQPRNFMHIGVEDGKFQAVCLSYLPNGNLFPYPSIAIFHNEGSKALRDLLKSTVMDTLRQNGYSRFLAVNASGRSDRAWEKMVQMPGLSTKKVGSLMLIEVDEE